ncbi:hypothetical protein [Streptomyces kanamyceticus]|uniref:pPIWI_RE_Z domain-containing protein n=1 Tax=Streptomyces kanamyceticus TaxID=1967 RepID=UPI0006E42E05|nr:hypothetical protein [Streptomyces kanamyceticus]
MVRDRRAWQQDAAKLLKEASAQAGVAKQELREALEMEFALYALSVWEPQAAARDGWALLRGFDFRPHSGDTPETNGSVRWLLSSSKKEEDWQERLATYAEFPEHLRLFEVKEPAEPPVMRELSLCRERHSLYAKALAGIPAHKTKQATLAAADVAYTFTAGGTTHRVRLPESIIPSPGLQHTPRQRRRMRPDWPALLATAKDMDALNLKQGRKPCNWYGRIRDLQLHLRGPHGLRRAQRLQIKELVHLAGMPAVGKTSVLTVLAVWAAQHGHTMTLVLGDVIAVLNMVGDLNRYVPEAAAPILGASTRGQHLRKLHRPPNPRTRGVQLLRDERLRWVSTACTVQGAMPDLTTPFPLGDAPCSRKLQRVAESPDGAAEGKQAQAYAELCACPMFFSCGRHEAARALVDAPIWVATAPGLVHCRVPAQLMDRDMRYLELAWERSDVIAFDEADNVQIQLDRAFSPSQTLAGPGKDAYVDEVRPLFEQHTRSTHCQHLTTSSTVRQWSLAVNSAGMLVARLRALLGEHHHVREWLRTEYFNEWRLAAQLAHEISLRPPPDADANVERKRWCKDEDVYQRWWTTLKTWLFDPAGRYRGKDKRVGALRGFAARGYDDTVRATRELAYWLEDDPDIVVGSTAARKRLAIRFQVVMTVALLTRQLDHLTRYSWEVEAETGAEGMSSSLVHRPPAEYLPLVPESPMGNMLGFQYREDEDAPADRLGTISFFRCSGIGRSLLLDLPRLFTSAANNGADEPVGPGVLLLSATSWAGNSPRYDVQAPVTGILTSRAAESVPVTERITCEYLPSRGTGPDGQPYDRTVSGKQGEERTAALTDLVADLCTAQVSLRGARPSSLEAIRGELEPGRQRLMLLVGNYQEAKAVHRKLVELRPEWAGQIMHMVPDDERGTHHWQGALARSRVSTLASHEDVWILITPMLAIERGHNILNDDHVAALGAALYLVRPHLHPEDLSYDIEFMNRWGIEQIRAGLPAAGPASAPLGERAKAFQNYAHRLWIARLEQSLRYTDTLPGSLERRGLDWTGIPPLNQIAGRMLRGAARARIYFCDGAFAPHSDDSILLGMYRALEEAMSGPHADIARPLYLPLMHGLHNLLEKYRGDV